MAYDVMIVSALSDMAKAEIVAKRLRALKFKVRLDAKREHTTPTQRDLNDAAKAGKVLVLWSKAACDTTQPDSDFVHAIAHVARSRKNALMQAGLDATVPDEPFDKDDRAKLVGMGPKRIPNGFYDLLAALEKKHRRRDLKDYLLLEPRDKDGKAAWMKAHPRDPISLAGKPKPKAKAKTPPKTATKTAPASETKPAVSPPASAPAEAPASTSGSLRLTPPKPGQTPTRMPYRRPVMVDLADKDKETSVGWSVIGPIVGGIAAMMLIAYFVRTEQALGPSMPAIGNATLPSVYAETCPPGQVPRSLIDTRPLRTGPIVDDTEDE